MPAAVRTVMLNTVPDAGASPAPIFTEMKSLIEGVMAAQQAATDRFGTGATSFTRISSRATYS